MTQSRDLQTRNGVFRVALDGPEDGPVLLLSNSLGTTLEMWAPQRAALVDGTQGHGQLRLVRYDSRGHGGSPRPAGSYRFETLGDDALAVMDALAIERAVFCGISMGGHTALWLGIHAAERLRGIVACNSAARIGSPAGWQERAAMVRRDGAAAMRALAATAAQRWFTESFTRARPDVVASAAAWLAATDPEGYAGCCDALAESDLRADLARIRVPTLLVAGAADPVTTVADAQAMQAAIAGAALVTLPASHLSNLEAAEPFNAALSDFIASLR